MNTASDHPARTSAQRAHLSRRDLWSWLIVGIAGVLAWVLSTLAVVWQDGYVVLVFPAGWCVYVAIKEAASVRSRA